MTSGVSGTSRSSSPESEYVKVGTSANIKNKIRKDKQKSEATSEVKQGRGGTTQSLNNYIKEDYFK